MRTHNVRTSSIVSFCIGCLLVCAGAFPLNGWVGYQFDPKHFRDDPFIGSTAHLLLGLVPLTIGIALMVLSGVTGLRIICYIFTSICFGLLPTLPILLHAKDLTALTQWLVIVGASTVLSAGIRAVIDLVKDSG